MKGVSAIIATILLLMITIGLAGTAYVYISGMMTGKMSKTISVLDASCNGSAITLVISNDGTDKILSSDIRIIVDNNDATNDFHPTEITPRNVSILTYNGGYQSGMSHTVLIVSPSNSITQRIWC